MTNPYGVDWSAIDMARDPESTCTCSCGAVFRSHTKFHGALSRPVSRKPCPKCGSYIKLRKISSDPESFSLRG